MLTRESTRPPVQQVDTAAANGVDEPAQPTAPMGQWTGEDHWGKHWTEPARNVPSVAERRRALKVARVLQAIAVLLIVGAALAVIFSEVPWKR